MMHNQDVPIYASEITYNDMKTDEQGFIKARNKLHGNDFPSQETISRYLPNHIVKNGDLIQLAGLKFRVINLPENETLTTTLYYFPEQNALFTGDFVVNQTIPFLGDGNSSNWVRQLRMLLARPELETGTAYPGHGKPAPAKEILQAQLKYIQTVRSLVIEALSSGNEVTPREKTDILAEMKEQYPDYQTSLLLPGLLERGIDGIAQELKKEKVQ